MRALCGAIIAAGSFIGLGLVSIAIGNRYSAFPYLAKDGTPQFVHFKDLDTALMIAFIVLIIGLLIGVAIAFVGLAYHHHRRHWEMHRTTTPPGAPPGTGTTTSERVSV